ncbi:Ig-like domain-containing protein [Pediococcus argentinicus]|nr:Ig-like domain-containing protein [Pediococcus argentinicus]NKZ22568.1 hypothetical protein [Pediococcus argentinicus]GEP19594.1 hypothetical protein LSA03_09780 [Pediococcus argentinicus]
MFKRGTVALATILMGVGLAGNLNIAHAKTAATPSITTQKLYQDDNTVAGKASKNVQVQVLNGKKVIGSGVTSSNGSFKIKLNTSLKKIKSLKLKSTDAIADVKVNGLKTNKVKAYVTDAAGAHNRPNPSVIPSAEASSDNDSRTQLVIKGYKNIKVGGELTPAIKYIKPGTKVSVLVTAKHYKPVTKVTRVVENIQNSEFFTAGKYQLVALKDMKILKNGPVIKKNSQFTYQHLYKIPVYNDKLSMQANNKAETSAIKKEKINIIYRGKTYQLNPISTKNKGTNTYTKVLLANDMQINRLVQNAKKILVLKNWLANITYGIDNGNSKPCFVNTTLKPNKYIDGNGATWTQYSYKNKKAKKVAAYKYQIKTGKWIKVK